MGLAEQLQQMVLKAYGLTPWPIPMFHVMAKPGGPACNMACKYCYYRHNSGALGLDDGGAISDELLEKFIREYIASQVNPTVYFTWQGGEPTLMGLDFYRKVLAIQKKYPRPGVQIVNDIQTNGLLLDNAWCEFLAANRFSVGLSIDGPADVHDANRKTTGGASTHERICSAMAYLKKHGIAPSTLSTITPANVERVDELYDFLTAQLGSTALQFQPCVERKDFRQVAPGFWDPATCPKVGSPQTRPGHPDSVVTDWSITAEQWGRFLCRFFDRWWLDRETVRVNWFDSWSSQMVGLSAHMCVCSPVCGRAVAMERDGKVYSCDHFVYPEYCIGDLNTSTLHEMVRSRRQRAFGEAKQTKLPDFCKRCPFLKLCYGECPKRRFLRTPDGELGLNYLCAGYRVFFAHARSRLYEYGRRFIPPKGTSTVALERKLLDDLRQ